MGIGIAKVANYMVTLDHAGSVGVFVLIYTAMLVVALTVGLFGPRTRGLSLEQI